MNKRIETFKDAIYKLNYKERPASIDEFIENPIYLGKSTDSGHAVFPIWRRALKEMFANNNKTLVLLTGSTSTGKSTIALYALCYIIHRLLCLRDPWGYFNLAPSDKMTISFFNLNKSLGGSRGYNKMQKYLTSSEWFKSKANYISETKNGEYLEFDLISFALSSPYMKGYGILGQDVVSGIMDEVDNPEGNVSEKQKILNTYASTLVRFKNRFAPDGYSLGKMFIVSSKQEENSFIDNFIEREKNNNSVLIYDIPVWEAKPKTWFCGKKFIVAVGTAYKESKIIEEDERIKAIQDGYELIDVPIEFLDDFKRDINMALKDIAGKTIAGKRKYKLIADGKFINDCFDITKMNPIEKETVYIGLEDDIKLIWFIDIDKIRLDKSVPRSVGLDISFSGDACSIAMSGIKEWKESLVQQSDGRFSRELLPIVETDFAIRVKAREGDRIPLHKLRQLIIDLKQLGFNIYKFRADLLLASEDTIQLLKNAHIDADYFSVDKTLKPYTDFRNMIYEKRWVYHNHRTVYFELKYLEISDGKVDHPVSISDVEITDDGDIKDIVMEGTKDVSDAICSSVVNAVYDAKRPIDVKSMNAALQQLKPKPDETSKIVAMPFYDNKGQEITGIKTSDGIQKLNDIFKRIKPGN